MAAFPEPPYEFNLEHANAAGVEFFRTIVTVVGGTDAWPKLNRSLPVKLYLMADAPALAWWERSAGPERAHLIVAAIPPWLWELLQTETTADQIRELAPQHGIYLPAVSE